MIRYDYSDNFVISQCTQDVWCHGRIMTMILEEYLAYPLSLYFVIPSWTVYLPFYTAWITDPDDPSPSIMYENNAGLRKNIWFKCQVTISEGNFVALDSWVLERHTGKTHKIWPYVAGDTTDRRDWRNSFSVSPTAIANFADRSDWRIKSASISSMSDTSEFACDFADDKIRCGRRIKSPGVSWFMILEEHSTY